MKEKHYRDGFSDGYITGYEKGLEEGSKLEYHDLLENPNDLPDTNREVLVLLFYSFKISYKVKVNGNS